MIDSSTASDSTSRPSARPTIRLTLPSGWARSVLAGIMAAVLGWLITTAVVLAGFWTVADNPWFGSLNWEDAQNFGGDLWAMAFGSPLQLKSLDAITGAIATADTTVAAVTYSATPLLLSLLALVLLRICLVVGRGYSKHALWFAIPAFCLTVAVEVAAAAPHSRLASVVWGSLMISVLATLWALSAHLRADAKASHDDVEPPLDTADNTTRVPRLVWLSEGLRLGRSAVVGLVLTSMVALVVTCFTQRQAIADIQDLLGTDSQVDQVFIWVFQAMFGPNFMAWAASWLAGPGFYLGTDALYSPAAAPVASIPAIPVFGAVPTTEPGYRVIWILIVVAIAVGCWNRWRHMSVNFLDQMLAGGVGVVLFVVVVYTWMQTSGMVLGTARLSMLGPGVWQTTAALTAEVAVVSVLVTVLLHPVSVAFMRKWVGFAGGKLKEARDAKPATIPLVPGVRPELRPTPLAPGAPTEAIKQPVAESSSVVGEAETVDTDLTLGDLAGTETDTAAQGAAHSEQHDEAAVLGEHPLEAEPDLHSHSSVENGTDEQVDALVDSHSDTEQLDLSDSGSEVIEPAPPLAVGAVEIDATVANVEDNEESATYCVDPERTQDVDDLDDNKNAQDRA